VNVLTEGVDEWEEERAASVELGADLERTQTHVANLEAKFILGFQDEEDTLETVPGSIVSSPESGGGKPCIPNIWIPARLKADRLKGTDSVPNAPGASVIWPELQCRGGSASAFSTPANDGEFRAPTCEHRASIRRDPRDSQRPCGAFKTMPAHAVSSSPSTCKAMPESGFAVVTSTLRSSTASLGLPPCVKAKQHRLGTDPSGADQTYQRANPSDYQAAWSSRAELKRFRTYCDPLVGRLRQNFTTSMMLCDFLKILC